jgi:hypothetical protein
LRLGLFGGLDTLCGNGQNHGHHDPSATVHPGLCICGHGAPSGHRCEYHSLIQEKTREQLRFEPGTETRNRKPLQQPAPFGATWEIRFGPDNRFRVLYDINEEDRLVRIMAVGEKQRERLFIGGEEVRL